jgi:hypothetical protein
LVLKKEKYTKTQYDDREGVDPQGGSHAMSIYDWREDEKRAETRYTAIRLPQAGLV